MVGIRLRAVKTDRRVLLLSYAEMKGDISTAVKKIVAHCNFDLSDAEVEALLPRFHVDAMKAKLAQFNPTSCRWKDKGDGQWGSKGTASLIHNAPSVPPLSLPSGRGGGSKRSAPL